jgi:hypothetical protein
MCNATIYTGTLCPHRWLLLTSPCRSRGTPNNLETCPSLRDRSVHIVSRIPPFPTVRAKPWTCPVCDYGGVYDTRLVRVVLRTARGVRVGVGPGPGGCGVDLGCVVL